MSKDFELRSYQTGQVGWIAPSHVTDNDRPHMVVHIKNDDTPFGNLVIKNAEHAMALRNLAGDYLLTLNLKGKQS